MELKEYAPLVDISGRLDGPDLDRWLAPEMEERNQRDIEIWKEELKNLLPIVIDASNSEFVPVFRLFHWSRKKHNVVRAMRQGRPRHKRNRQGKTEALWFNSPHRAQWRRFLRAAKKYYRNV